MAAINLVRICFLWW